MVGEGQLSVEDYRQIFVDRSNLLNIEDFNHIVTLSHKNNRPLEPLLVEKSFISPVQYLQLSSAYFGVQSTNLRQKDINPEALSFLDQNEALRLLAIPFDFDDKSIKIAIVNPKNKEVIEKLHNNNQLDINFYITTEQAIRRALILYDSNIDDILKKALVLAPGEATNPASPQLALSIIEAAVMAQASDVHIEPYDDTVLIRIRVDGLLKQIASIPVALFPELVTNLKIKAALRIDQSRLPQDGRFSLDIKGQEVNIRISLVPSLWGEKIVMRVLLKEAHLFDLSSLGLLDSDLELVRKNIKRPFGMILVCGPTGSGKTTTLYAFLQEIGMEKVNVVNISTIEDPIEYTIPRVTQIQTQPDINLSFASGLRALLRQDPDIIMVGEVRDEETADISVRAALVGRLVITSIHTNDALGAIPRLLDMGIEPYLLSSTIQLVVAQRLARKLCTFCRQSHQLDEESLKSLKEHNDIESMLKTLERTGITSEKDPLNLRFFKAVGCDKCDNTGYIGRVGIYEVLEISDQLRSNINSHANSDVLRKTAIENGMKTMFEDGFAKVILGIIDLNELIRVVYQ